MDLGVSAPEQEVSKVRGRLVGAREELRLHLRLSRSCVG